MSLVGFSVCPDQQFYYPGQMLSGKLVIVLNKPMSMKAIYVKCFGEGSVCWTKTRCRPRIGGCAIETVKYKNSEEYLSLKQLVFGNDAEIELPMGQHVIPFHCQLPMNLPSSFEGVNGNVRYSIKATIKRSTWKSDHRASYPVTMISPCDLNDYPLAAEAGYDKKIKTFWVHSGTLLMYVFIPALGFAPGQKIPLVVLLGNTSNVRVKSVDVSLLQGVTVYAPPRSKTTTAYVYRDKIVVRNGLLEVEEVPIDFVLPPVPPSIGGFCNIIDINYQLHVEAELECWCHKNLKVESEILVGNIPLANYDTLCNALRGLIDSALTSAPILDD